MEIRIYKGCDYRAVKGRLIQECSASAQGARGMVGYYHFPELDRYAWCFVPAYSAGDFQDARSPRNYESLQEASDGFAEWAAR